MNIYVVEPGGIVRPEPDFDKLSLWTVFAERKSFDDGGRVVARDVLPDGTLVSTVFLSADHRMGNGPPVLFETMVFDCPAQAWNDFQSRYCTVEEARAGHADIVERLRTHQEPP